MKRPLTERQCGTLVKQSNDYRYGKLRRDYELELLLNANVPLAEAKRIVDGPNITDSRK